MGILYIILAALVTGIVVYFMMKRKADELNTSLTTERNAVTLRDQMIATSEGEKKRSVQKIQDLEAEKLTLSQSEAVLKEKVISLKGELDKLTTKLQETSKQLEGFRTDRDNVQNKLVEVQTKLDAVATLEERTQTFQEHAMTHFQNIADTLLETKTEKFTKLNQTNLAQVLSPVQTLIADFKKTIDDTYKSESSERNSLRGAIGELLSQTEKISTEATNLTNALRSDTKMQGDWGEFVLKRVLEASGLRKDEDFRMQENFVSENGKVRPDAVVYLPDDKHIVIDAKVSLTAYERFVNSNNETERKTALKDHTKAVRSRVTELSNKSYYAIDGINAPDFTLLFMPIEQAFGTAVIEDRNLFTDAWEHQIVIVSPSTLFATLRTIASIWKHEQQTKNALEIAKRAGRLYDKFVGFVDDLSSVGKEIDKTKEVYTTTMNKLFNGAGNLVRQTEMIKVLGANATKQLPQSLLDRAD